MGNRKWATVDGQPQMGNRRGQPQGLPLHKNNMANFLGYKCSLCGAEYAPDQIQYVCPKHGDMGNLDVVLDYAAIKEGGIT